MSSLNPGHCNCKQECRIEHDQYWADCLRNSIPEFKRILSNLINNSVDAFRGPRKVEVLPLPNLDSVRVTVTWNLRFTELREITGGRFNVHYLTCAEELRKVAHELSGLNAQFLIDYELSSLGPNGLDLIDELHLKSAVLVAK